MSGQEPARNSRATLSTVYAEATNILRIGDVDSASERGERCMVLGNFSVSRIFGVSGSEVTKAESLICLRCRACGHTFPPSIAGDLHSAKRQRRILPCGHWLFRLEFRFKLELHDNECAGSAPFIWVFVADESGELLRARPEDVLLDAATRQRVQRTLDSLLQAKEERGHTLAVYRVDGPAYFGAYVVCDTVLRTAVLGTSA